MTVARLVGGVTNDVPGGVGRGAGWLVAVDPTIAAACPPIVTVEHRLPSSRPLNGWGSGVGTRAGPAGTMTRWMSVPTTWSLALAAGCPTASSVQRDRLAGDLDAGVAGDLDVGALQRQRAGRLHGDIAALLHGDRGAAHLERRLGVAARRLLEGQRPLAGGEHDAAVVDVDPDRDRPAERQR